MDFIISIIIPVYKTEQYISQCIDSIIIQGIENFEIILVNDGSPDNSGKICDEYAEKDARIRVFHNRNIGASGSRNFGIKKATGDYLMFLDSDDFFEKNSLNNVNAILNNNAYEVVLGKFNYFYENSNIKKTISFEYDINGLRKKKGQEVISYLFDEIPEQTWAAWRNIYKKDFLVKNELYFNETLEIGEDLDWFTRVMLCTNRVSCIQEPIICYRLDREGSATSSLNLKKCNDSIWLSKYWIEYTINSDIQAFVKQSIYNRFAFNFSGIFFQLKKVPKMERKELKKLIVANISLLNFSNKKDIILLKWCYRFFGVIFTANILEFRGFVKRKLKKD